MDRLLQRYAHLALTLPSGNATTLIEPWVPTSTNGIITHSDQIIRMPASLLAIKDSVIAREQSRGALLYNGENCVLAQSRPGFLTVVKGEYFDGLTTTRALAQEINESQWPLRDRIDFFCEGNPLQNGRGRHSGVGISALLVFEQNGQQWFCLGKRNANLVYSPGCWHSIPSGGLQWGQGVSGTLANEMQEELLIGSEQINEALQTSKVIGLIYNLVDLSTDVAIISHYHGPMPMASPSEHSDLRCWTFDQQGIEQALSQVQVSDISEALLTLAGMTL